MFPGNLSCFTAVFVFGERAQCKAATISRGGQCKESVLKQPRDGRCRRIRHRPMDTKRVRPEDIGDAVDYRTKGGQIQVVSEEFWEEAVRAAPTIVT